MELSYYADPYTFMDVYDSSIDEIIDESEAYWSEWNQLKSDIVNHNTFYIRDFMQEYKDLFVDSGDTELAAECDEVIAELSNKKITSNMSMFGEDNGFWTRDDIDELGYAVADYITEKGGFDVEYYSGYANSDKEIEITVDYPFADQQFTHTDYIDFRKIKVPRDLITRYVKVFGDALIGEIEDFQREFGNDI